MIGGYLSFQGIEGKANYRATPLSEVLPVELELGDDRQEAPQGAVAHLTETGHPVTAGISGEWPTLLGFQRLVAKQDSQVLATIDGWPLLVVGRFGKGRVLAFASDMGPHWAPPGFTEWPGLHQVVGASGHLARRGLQDGARVMASPCADASSRCQLACGNRPFLDELRMAETWVRRRNTIDTLPQPHVHLHTEYRELLRGFVPALHVLLYLSIIVSRHITVGEECFR